jgi:hypothetical protein
MHIKLWLVNLKGRDHSEEDNIRIELKEICVGRCGMDSCGSG